VWEATLTRFSMPATSSSPPPKSKQLILDFSQYTPSSSSSSSSSFSSPPSSSSSSMVTSTRPPSAAQCRNWSSRLLRVTAEMNLSFRSLTESKEFREWMKEALRWDVPSREVVRRALPVHYASLVRKLKIKLESSSSISITTDSTYLTRQNVPLLATSLMTILDCTKLCSLSLSHSKVKRGIA